MDMITAEECIKISAEPEMRLILELIERAAKKGETQSNLGSISEIQALKLKELGFKVAWHSHQEYSGGYKAYWGMDGIIKPKGFLEKWDNIIFEREEYYI